MTSKTILTLIIDTTFVTGAIVVNDAVFTQESERLTAFAPPESDFFETNLAAAQEPSDIKEGIISVTGTANISVDPNLLMITFGVETQEVTAKLALDANSKNEWSDNSHQVNWNR